MRKSIYLCAAILGSVIVSFSANAVPGFTVVGVDGQNIWKKCTDTSGKSYANATCEMGRTAMVCNCIINGSGNEAGCLENFNKRCH